MKSRAFRPIKIYPKDLCKSQTKNVRPASIFEEILVFSLTTSTKKNGSEATLGTLGKEKLKFTKKTPPAKCVYCKLPIYLLKYML